ncbi:MAG TPA: hypothetical protein PKA05_13565 [Roseiflexaceae bacterium]|nr:hypothetical protein [Roseiflexaceae bacterium]HMP41404.1 hypothetical protein [Roseiflexaceae bacterium]
MDVLAIVGVGGLILVAAVVVGLVMRKAWGDFPTHAGEQPARHPPTPPSLPASPLLPPAGAAAPGISPAYTTEDLVPIENEMVRRSAEQALERGSPMARYLVRHGDQIFFSFSSIADPGERQAAYDLMRRFNAGEQIDFREILRLLQRMGRD